MNILCCKYKMRWNRAVRALVAIEAGPIDVPRLPRSSSLETLGVNSAAMAAAASLNAKPKTTDQQGFESIELGPIGQDLTPPPPYPSPTVEGAVGYGFGSLDQVTLEVAAQEAHFLNCENNNGPIIRGDRRNNVFEPREVQKLGSFGK